MKLWNHWQHETYETMYLLTPRNTWNHETIDTRKSMKPWNHWHHQTHQTMKPLTPRNLWNHETVNTTKSMKPWNTWNYETTDTRRPKKPWLHYTIIIWHRHWDILISINWCTVTPSCNRELHCDSVKIKAMINSNLFFLRQCDSLDWIDCLVVLLLSATHFPKSGHAHLIRGCFSFS